MRCRLDRQIRHRLRSGNPGFAVFSRLHGKTTFTKGINKKHSMLLRPPDCAAHVVPALPPVELGLLLALLLLRQARQPPAHVALSIVPVKLRQLLISLHRCWDRQAHRVSTGGACAQLLLSKEAHERASTTLNRPTCTDAQPSNSLRHSSTLPLGK